VPQPPLLADGEFFFQDQVQEVQVAHLGGVSPFHMAGERLGQVRQAELGRGGPDPCGDQLAHALSFGSAAGTVLKGRVPVIWS
jgi:hypothetical protein